MTGGKDATSLQDPADQAWISQQFCQYEQSRSSGRFIEEEPMRARTCGVPQTSMTGDDGAAW